MCPDAELLGIVSLETVGTDTMRNVDFLADAETMGSRGAFDDGWGLEGRVGS